LLSPSTQRDPKSFSENHRKKPTALLIGYDGTSFKGNTSNNELPRGAVVDDVLEDALFAAGCIKLSNYRSRGLGRLKWSRSSRTDKGVSSLATVVSCRLEVDPGIWGRGEGDGGDVDGVVGDSTGDGTGDESYVGDCVGTGEAVGHDTQSQPFMEGKSLCDAINKHLPPSIKVRIGTFPNPNTVCPYTTDTFLSQVFAAYSTPKSFQARRACVKRTYDYLLPARCLGIYPAAAGDIRKGESGDIKKQESGDTVKQDTGDLDFGDDETRGDIPGGVDRVWPGTERTKSQSDAKTLLLFREALSNFVGSHHFHNYTKRAMYSRGKWDGKKDKRNGKSAADDEEVLESEIDEIGDDETDVATDETNLATDDSTKPGAKYIGSKADGLYWLLERDDSDLVGIKHNRRVSSFTAGDVEFLSSDSSRRSPFIRVTIRGDSFMLYQVHISQILQHCLPIQD